MSDTDRGDGQEMGTAVIRRDEQHPERGDRSQLPTGMLEPVADPGEVVRARTKRSEFIADALEEGRDYGSVPGIPKPFLQKPGAERLTDAFGCYPRFRILDQEVDHDRRVEWEKRNKDGEIYDSGTSRGLYRYVVSCDLVHRASGVVVGNGLGACSTMEKKYVDRPRESENVALKMAKKRAHVDAALSTFGLSEMFTQDADYVRETDQGHICPDLEDKVGFGKHSDMTWLELAIHEGGYVKWLIDQGTDHLCPECTEMLRDAVRERRKGGKREDTEEGFTEEELLGEGNRSQAQAAFFTTISRHIEDGQEPREVGELWARYWNHLNSDVPEDLSDWTVERFDEAREAISSDPARLVDAQKWVLQSNA